MKKLMTGIMMVCVIMMTACGGQATQFSYEKCPETYELLREAQQHIIDRSGGWQNMGIHITAGGVWTDTGEIIVRRLLEYGTLAHVGLSLHDDMYVMGKEQFDLMMSTIDPELQELIEDGYISLILTVFKDDGQGNAHRVARYDSDFGVIPSGNWNSRYTTVSTAELLER